MCFFGMLLLMAPPLLLILIAVLFVISFTVLFLTKAVVKLNKDEIAFINGSMVPLVLTAWAFNVLSLAITLIITDIISFSIPFLDRIHTEFGLAASDAYVPAIIYVISFALIYAALLTLSSHFVFKNKITNKPKKIIIMVSFVASSVCIWALFISYAIGLL